MGFLPEWSLPVIFIIAAMLGGAASFARKLDLSIDPPIKIRFYAELFRTVFLAFVVGVSAFPVVLTYGPRPPLSWTVAAFVGAFAPELMMLAWKLFETHVMDRFFPKQS